MALKHVYSGKVRDIYEVDDRHLLFVASDRISAFDVVMAEPIPDKGRVLTAMTAFWQPFLNRRQRTDVILADASDAIVIGFSVTADPGARRVAEERGVDIRTYSIIYELIEDIEAAVKDMMAVLRAAVRK